MTYSLKPVIRCTTYAAPLPQHHRPFHSSMDRVSMSSKVKPSLFHCLHSSTSQLYVDHPITSTNHHIIPAPWPTEEEEQEEDINSQKLDQWVRDSAHEIVKSIDEAPFLVHVYCNDTNSDGSRIKTVKEKAVADTWPMIEGRWKQGSRTPNGVILVEQLNHPLAVDDQNINNNELCSSSSSTKLWGILIQGKRKSCTACYLLKTSRVQGVAGFCTHFCLSRVDCFLERADILLKKLWLQMG